MWFRHSALGDVSGGSSGALSCAFSVRLSTSCAHTQPWTKALAVGTSRGLILKGVSWAPPKGEGVCSLTVSPHPGTNKLWHLGRRTALRAWSSLRSLSLPFLDCEGSLPPSASKSNLLPFVPPTEDELPGSRPGARRSLHGARSRRPRVPRRGALLPGTSFSRVSPRSSHGRLLGPRKRSSETQALCLQPSLPLHGSPLPAGPVPAAPSRSQGAENSIWPQRGRVGSSCPIPPKPA